MSAKLIELIEEYDRIDGSEISHLKEELEEVQDELTTEVADLKSKLNFANAMNADQDKTVAELAAEVSSLMDVIKDVNEWICRNNLDGTAHQLHLAEVISRNALKEGL